MTKREWCLSKMDPSPSVMVTWVDRAGQGLRWVTGDHFVFSDRAGCEWRASVTETGVMLERLGNRIKVAGKTTR